METIIIIGRDQPVSVQLWKKQVRILMLEKGQMSSLIGTISTRYTLCCSSSRKKNLKDIC